MTKITWLGEDELHGGGAGPSFTTAFGGIKFPKGEAVDVSDPDIIDRARKSRFFSVEGDESEADGGDALDEMKIAELRELADARGIDHEGMGKPELRDALRA